MNSKIKFVGILTLMLLAAVPALAAGFDAQEGMSKFFEEMGFISFFMGEGWKNAVMLFIGCVLLYLAIKKEYEPLLLLPIAFGMILTNLPGAGMFDSEMWNNEFLNADSPNYHSYGYIMAHGGLLDILYIGVKAGVYPCLIFLGVGAMTDFGPLIANPKTLLLGAAAQAGVFVALLGAMLLGFSVQEAAAIGIIGGADGPTSIYLAAKMAPQLLGAIAVAAYSYMSLVPLIQPPIMHLFTTEADRKIVMKQLRPVSKFEKVVFPIMTTIVISLLLPSVTALIGMLMLGNLFKEAGCLDRLSDTAQNALMNTVTIMLATGTGLTMSAESFLNYQTILIIFLGLVAFIGGTAAGVIFGKLMCTFDGGQTNPLIGSAGVSAVPMAARVSQIVGQKANPANFLLMHAMGPNVAGVIGTAVAAGTMLAMIGPVAK